MGMKGVAGGNSTIIWTATLRNISSWRWVKFRYDVLLWNKTRHHHVNGGMSLCPKWLTSSHRYAKCSKLLQTCLLWDVMSFSETDHTDILEEPAASYLQSTSYPENTGYKLLLNDGNKPPDDVMFQKTILGRCKEMCEIQVHIQDG
jgi:hypothetical protein